jgi:hypothetical protein
MYARWSLLAVLALALPASAFELRRDADGGVLKWSGHLEFVIDERLAIQLGEGRADLAVEAAVATLGDASPALTVSSRVGHAQGLGYRVGAGDNQSEILALAEWPFDPRALAATVVTVNLRTGRIIDADIAFNTQERRFRVVDPIAEVDRNAEALDDVQNTVTHELGHALGLMHNCEDEEVVMYPSAPPRETSKRVLAPDDLAGLAALYGPPPEALDAGASQEPIAAVTAGCSGTGSTGAPAALLALAFLLLLRPLRAVAPAPRRSVVRAAGVALALLALAPALAVAAPRVGLERLAPDLAAAEQVSLAQVKAVRTVRVPTVPGLLFSEVELEVQACLKGACPATAKLLVPGGREGDLEQIVAHQPVPEASEQVLLVEWAQRPRLLRLQDRVHRDLAELALGRIDLRLPVSVVTRGVGSPRAGTPQAPATTR